MSSINTGIRIKLSVVHIFTILIFCLSSFYFYGPAFLHEQSLKFFYWALVILLFGFSFKRLLYSPETLRFTPFLRLLLISMFVSMLPALLFWGQGPDLTIRAMFPYLGFILYFYLLTIKPSLKWLVRLIWFLAFLYIVVYLFSLTQAPDVIFGSFADKDVDDNRGIFRLFIPGRGFLFLAFFMAVSNYLYSKRVLWLWIAAGLFMVIMAHVIRQYILFSFIIAGWVLFWNVPLWKKMIFLLLGVIAGYYVYLYSPVIQTLISLTEIQVVDNVPTENIRITAYRYFFTEFSPNSFCSIFGNGVPHAHSSYGRYYNGVINEQMRLYLSDVGYAQIYAQFGVIGLLAVICIFIRAFFVKIPAEFLYLKLFIIFVFFANFMSGYFLSNNNVVVISIVLFMIEIVSKKEAQGSRGNSTNNLNKLFANE